MIKIDNELDRMLKSMNKAEKEQLWAELEGYIEAPVDIITFLDDPYFLANSFEDVGGFYPYWKKWLKKLYPHPLVPSQYNECLVTGSIGTGKTTFAVVSTIYSMYRVSLLDNPHRTYGLSNAVDIKFLLVNITLDLVVDVLWKYINNMLSASEYFQSINATEKVPKNKRPEEVEIVLPNNVGLCMASKVEHTLGRAVFGAILDETSFNKTIKSGAQKVYEIYNSIRGRLSSRFQEAQEEGKVGGNLPGQIFLVSSKRDESDFLETRIETIRKKNVETSLIIDACIFDVKKDVVKPNGKRVYCGETFQVFVGNQTQEPVIIKRPDELLRYDDSLVIDVPIEHRDVFETDIGMAIRDLAGVSTTSKFKFFPNTELVKTAMRKVVNVCRGDYLKLSFDDDDQLLDYIQEDYLLTYLHKNPMAKRVIHLDMSRTHDAFGFAMGCICGLKEIVRGDPVQMELTGQAIVTEPVVRIELALGILRGSSFQIPFFKVRKLILDLARMGFPIGIIQADSYQSTDMLQLMKRVGFEIKEVSLDKTKLPYISFKNSIYEERTELPGHPILYKELENLRDTGKKIDHPDEGSVGKDIADACAGVYFTLMELYKQNAFEYFSTQMESQKLPQRTVFGEDEYDKLFQFENRFGDMLGV
jgi:hypothetical protein